jgi:AcrR family transcriptional regulator
MAPSSPGSGSRAQRRARIEQVALELFRSRGFDRVTVEDVCLQAGVAPATFYRYFGSKEEVVFAYREAFAEALDRALDAGGHAGEAARLVVVLEHFAAYLESQSDVLAMRDQIVMGQPRLMQRTLSVQREFEGVLAAGLARTRGAAGPETEDLLRAGVGMAVLRVAVRSWRADGDVPLLEEVRRTYTLLQAFGAR